VDAKKRAVVELPTARSVLRDAFEARL